MWVKGDDHTKDYRSFYIVIFMWITTYLELYELWNEENVNAFDFNWQNYDLSFKAIIYWSCFVISLHFSCSFIIRSTEEDEQVIGDVSEKVKIHKYLVHWNFRKYLFSREVRLNASHNKFSYLEIENMINNSKYSRVHFLSFSNQLHAECICEYN